MIEHPKLFISYTHEDRDHQSWVDKLATDLRQHMGIDVIYDQWDLRIGKDLVLFMEQGLSSSSLVLCIISENYTKKANEGVGGVGYERLILTSELIKNADIDYIIPIKRHNSKNDIPLFLATKYYIDFSDDNDYQENLKRLTARIYDEDFKIKPPLGINPFLKNEANRIKNRTSIEISSYHKVEHEGVVTFDFTNNNGTFLIGMGEYEFRTQWSSCSGNSIYVYSDGVELLGCSDNKNIPNAPKFDNCNFTSRVRRVPEGGWVVLLNKYDKFAVTKVLKVLNKGYGADRNELTFEYQIFK